MSFDGRDNTKNLWRFISIVIPSKKEFGLIFLSFIYKVVGIYNSDDIVNISDNIYYKNNSNNSNDNIKSSSNNINNSNSNNISNNYNNDDSLYSLFGWGLNQDKT